MTYPAVGKNADLRPQAELVRERDVHPLEARRAMGFDRGAYDTLNWLITGGDGPLTGQMVVLAPSRRGDRARTGRGRGDPVRNIVFCGTLRPWCASRSDRGSAPGRFPAGLWRETRCGRP
jgi:hypothetical protein